MVRDGSNHFDVDMSGGSLVTLNSDTDSGREVITDQRVVKALLSGKYLFEKFYGANLKAVIGSKSNILNAVESVNSLNAFFSKYAGSSGNLAITVLSASIRDNKIFVSAVTKLKSVRKFVFNKGVNNG